MTNTLRKSIVLACLVFGTAVFASADMANLPVKTMGGNQVWADVRYHGGWRIQENVLTGHCRVLDHRDVRQSWGERADCEKAFDAAIEEHGLKNTSTHAIVLLHGLGRRRAMFARMEGRLREEGYEVISLAYPSTRRNVDEHASQIEGVLASLEGIDEVSFVTHSLGGIVTRRVLSRQHAWQEGLTPRRVVMLGPPNQGAAMARIAPDWAAEPVLGEVIVELRQPLKGARPSDAVEFGVIAGGRNGKGYNPLIPGDDDGVVGVSETHLSGASDFLVITGIHSFLPANPVAIEATVEFLKSGQFSA